MKIVRYINGEKIKSQMPRLCVDNPVIVKTILKMRAEELYEKRVRKLAH